jgi:hypothetical protein
MNNDPIVMGTFGGVVADQDTKTCPGQQGHAAVLGVVTSVNEDGE